MFEERLSGKYRRWFCESPYRGRIDHVAKSLVDRQYLTVVVVGYAHEWIRFVRSFSRRGLPIPTTIHAPEVKRYLRRRFSSGSASRFRCIRAAIRIFLEMHEDGRFPSRIRKPARPTTALFDALVPSYMAFLARYRNVAPCTLRKRRYQLAMFTETLQTAGISDWRGVDASRIRDFLTGLKGIRPPTRRGYAHTLRSFFRWAYLNGAQRADLSAAVPTIRNFRLTSLPDVLSEKEYEALLGGIDRSIEIGRRDYALLLLAARYGMRASDIRQLSLDHIDWGHRRIALVQSKTGRELVLPLLPDVSEALRDYIRRGRPRTESRFVFIRHKAPFEPFCAENNFSDVMRRALHRAGLDGRKGARGLYLFRHTLATRLLSAGQSLKTIGDILGHVTSQSTLIYTKVDLPALRTVAVAIREILG